jgi:hypothetical protein
VDRDEENYSDTMKRYIFFLVLYGIFCFSLAQPPLVWTRVYDGSMADYAFSVSTDSQDNIIVAGSSYNGADYDFCIIKYTSAGDTIWTRTFDTGGSDLAQGVVVDGYGDIVVCGSSRMDTIYDYLTVKYDASGNFIWQARYLTGMDNIGTSVVTDSALNIMVTGYSFNGLDYDYLTVKYDANGDTIWSRRFNAGFNDIANDITADPIGNIIVTGASVDTSICLRTYLTVKYNPAGETLWTRRYHYWSYDSFGRGVAADAEGNIAVCGHPLYPACFVTVKYDSQGNTAWIRSHYLPNPSWAAQDVAIDNNGEIIVTGEYYKYSILVPAFVYHTHKYSAAGDELWAIDYESGNGIDDYARGVACDNSGGIIVTGYRIDGGNADYLAVKYDEQGALAEQTLLPVRARGVELYTPYPNPFDNNCCISFESGNLLESEITVCDVSGRRLRTVFNGQCTPGLTKVDWDGTDGSGRKLPSGVYFVRLETSEYSMTRKIVKLK